MAYVSSPFYPTPFPTFHPNSTAFFPFVLFIYPSLQARSKKGKIASNLSPALNNLLKDCRRMDELPGVWRSAMQSTKMALKLDVELSTFDSALLKRIIYPSSFRVDNPIDTRTDIEGFSIFHMIPRGATSVKINNLKVCIPDDADTAIDMLALMTINLSILRPKKHFLLHQIEMLHQGCHRHRRQLKKLFDTGGDRFGFFLFKKIHNEMSSYLGDCYDEVSSSHTTLDFARLVRCLKQNDFPVITKSNGSSSSSSSGRNSSNHNQEVKDKDKQSKQRSTSQPRTRGTGNGPYVSTLPDGKVYTFPADKVNKRNNPPIPTDSTGKRLCFNRMVFATCGNTNCSFSHDIGSYTNKITEWITGNNIPLKKRE